MPNSTTFPVCAFANTAWLTNAVCVEEAADCCQQNSDEQRLVPGRIPVMFARIPGKRRQFKSARRKGGRADRVAHAIA